MGVKNKYPEGILYFVRDEFAGYWLRDSRILEPLHEIIQVERLANVDSDLLAPLQLVGLHIGQHAVHALVPHGHNDGYARRLIDNAPDTPLETHLLLGHVHLALGKDVHPLPQSALFDAQIDGLLVDAIATHHRYAFTYNNYAFLVPYTYSFIASTHRT